MTLKRVKYTREPLFSLLFPLITHKPYFAFRGTAEHISFIAACQEDEENNGSEHVSTTELHEGKRSGGKENGAKRTGGPSKEQGTDVMRIERTPVRNFSLMYKVQENKSISSADEFDRKCERIRNYLSKLNIKMKDPKNPETNDVSYASRPRKRLYPPLKLPTLTIFNSSNKKSGLVWRKSDS